MKMEKWKVTLLWLLVYETKTHLIDSVSHYAFIYVQANELRANGCNSYSEKLKSV